MLDTGAGSAASTAGHRKILYKHITWIACQSETIRASDAQPGPVAWGAFAALLVTAPANELNNSNFVRTLRRLQ